MAKKQERIFLVLMVLSMANWGGSWVSGKIVSRFTAPEVLVFWRFFFTFISLIPIILFRKESIKISSRNFLWIILGSILMVIYNQLFFSGLIKGFAGAGGVLVTSLNPIFTFILSALFFKSKIRNNEKIGCLLGLIAGCLLITGGISNINQFFLSGNLLFLFAAITWAIINIVSQIAQKELSAYIYSLYIYGFSSLIDFGLAYPKGVFEVFNFSSLFWWNMVYLAVFATTFSLTVYFYSSKKLGASKASSFMYLVPLSAMVLSFIILNERPTYPTIIGGGLAVVAVYFINLKKEHKYNKKVLQE